MRIALYEPDIPQNTGTILRLCACLGLEAHIIEPAGFPVTDRAFRRAGMDYLDRVAITRHGSFQAFEEWRRAERLRSGAADDRRRAQLSRPGFRDDQICCSAAKAPACRRRSTRPPMSGCAFRCARACARSMWRWRWRWWPARRCGRRGAFRSDKIAVMTQVALMAIADTVRAACVRHERRAMPRARCSPNCWRARRLRPVSRR